MGLGGEVGGGAGGFANDDFFDVDDENKNINQAKSNL